MADEVLFVLKGVSLVMDVENFLMVIDIVYS